MLPYIDGGVITPEEIALLYDYYKYDEERVLFSTVPAHVRTSCLYMVPSWGTHSRGWRCTRHCVTVCDSLASPGAVRRGCRSATKTRSSTS